MELRTFAERVLHGTSLEDKLVDPGRLTDTAPGRARSRPDAPGRPDGLALSRRPDRRPLPGPDALADVSERARVLHAFANHELLALELMALVLLRFPDAEPAFRRTLAATMRDEQRHLGLYLDRVRALGGEVGGAPASAFFWDCLADVSDPAAFVAGMSLTLEQANLDFSRHWRDRFAAVGDDATATVLDEVYRDEVRHVRHGVRWLQTWSQGEDLWTAWTRRLSPPLSPRRGRGPVFDAEGRARAGLDPTFVDRVRAAGGSRGRPPHVYWFAPWFEADLAASGHTPPDRVRAIQADLAPTLLFLAGEDDRIIVPRVPSPTFLASLSDRGIPLPELTTSTALPHPVSSVTPWGRSPGLLRALGLPAEDCSATATLARKDTAARVLATLDPDPRLDLEGGVRVTSLDALDAALRSVPRPVVKAPLSTAGRERVLPRGALTPAERRRLERLLERQGALVVEPWRERVLDLSLQATVTDAGVVSHGVGRFLTDAAGRYRGAVLGRWHRDLPQDVRRFLAGDGRDPAWVERGLRRALEAALVEAPDFRGPIGIDALVARIGGQLRLRPLVEINPRLTFGRVAGAVADRLVRAGSQATWWHLDRRDLTALGAPSFEVLQRRLAPIGAIATTEAAAASVVWTVLVPGGPGALAASADEAADHQPTSEP